MQARRPLIASRNGVVAAAHPLAAAAGARILGRGGNAFDAAVATAAALGVVEPAMSGLAGLGMATCWVAGDRRVRTLSFRTPVPAEFPSDRVHGREDLVGLAALAPPGNLAGWYDLLSAHGTLTLADALAPAIGLARDGFPLVESGVAALNHAARDFRDLPFYPEWTRTYADGRGQVRFGQVLRQPELAATLEAIAAEGPRHLYGGRLGQAMVAHVRALGGFLSMADLEAVASSWGRSVSVPYRDLTVHAPAPPSQAFQYLLTLRILDGFDLAAMERDGVEHLDTVWRATRLAAMERIAHDEPSEEELEQLLGEETVERLRTRVADGLPIEGAVERWEGQHTTSLSAADRAGNVVCMTESLGGLFGCGVVVPGTGVCLNNALYWGEHHPRGVDALVPGRTLTTPFAPSVALRGGRPVLALGTPGSYAISQVQAQAMVQHVDFGLPIQAAIEAPRALVGAGRRVPAESRFAPAVLEALRARGHDIEPLAAWATQVGGMQGVAVDPRTGVITGGADPRQDGHAVGA
jgi:gamma-glutamyltranspeptidase/glutathione hydrolase